MFEISDRLDPTSEMLALSTTGDTKNVLICLIELYGPLDVDSTMEAARLAALKFPQLTRTIKEIRFRGRYYLAWDTETACPLPVFFHEMKGSRDDEPILDRILELLKFRLDRDWDLFHEPVAEFHLIRISPQRHVGGWLMHHVAGDAATGTDVGQETLAQYHEIRYEKKPEWGDKYLSLSGSKKRRVTRKKLTARNHFEDIRQTFENLFGKPSLPVGSGTGRDKSQYHVKRVLTEAETATLYDASNNHGVAFIDRIVGSANKTIDEWNLARGVSPGLLTTSMSVNMKGRFIGADLMNSSSLIFFKSSPSERTDTRSFMRKIALSRIRHFRNQTDLKLSQNIKMMTDAFRFLPFRYRKHVISFLINRHEFSIAITSLGTVWPKIQNGKHTLQSAVTKIGDLEAVEIFGVAYRMLSRTGMLLVLYTFRNRLNFVLTCSGSLLTRNETQKFLDLFLKNLKEYQMSQPC